ncbi:hypothetical protein KCTCHS21_18280 [Cohnella abietis]|uniref:Uncharacterized protein n=1 Tax=Cohnella abietis TaxID=2507935 RepID=A0A3T1D328_9BACL|nr:hypothetical protein KCTCHS21_18280 [Cohnella abietis]
MSNERWSLEEARLERVVRNFRATGCGRGTIGGSYTNISSNGVWKRHDWREQYEIFEQRDVEEARWE